MLFVSVFDALAMLVQRRVYRVEVKGGFMKSIFMAAALLLLALSALMLFAQGQNHGATLTWTASSSAAGCLPTGTPTCTGGYNVFEGPSGNESAASLNGAPLAALTYTDNGATMNVFLGTTRCYVIQYQEVIGGTLTLNSANSNEVCFSFPALPTAPTSLGGSMH